MHAAAGIRRATYPLTAVRGAVGHVQRVVKVMFDADGAI